MKKVLLVNEGKTPHYRVPVYIYLSEYLQRYDFRLTLLSEGLSKNSIINTFCHYECKLNLKNMKRMILYLRPDIIIFWVGPRFYMFPILLLSKLLGIKVIHWGHRRPMGKLKILKNFYYNLEHFIDDAIVLYSKELRKYVWKIYQSKTFIANNTLYLGNYERHFDEKDNIKNKYGINTTKNIICMGRMMKRKRIDDLVNAFQMIDLKDVGLILAGPDSDGILKNLNGKNIFKIGPVYGKESLELLAGSDVYCLPGWVGLSIVDAFYCGLPIVTEDVQHAPEIMYLRDGINGFMVPEGDIVQLSGKLNMLLKDDELRRRFSQAAKKEIKTNGHIDRMCEGFIKAILHACRYHL